mmetsp:Transcript_18854/g.54573  ORF Transcript_18854/g.54573 Transcript_18854/m.54573 type:complete len:584 (-) Transcript_18854:70-1821(-)
MMAQDDNEAAHHHDHGHNTSPEAVGDDHNLSRGHVQDHSHGYDLENDSKTENGHGDKRAPYVQALCSFCEPPVKVHEDKGHDHGHDHGHGHEHGHDQDQHTKGQLKDERHRHGRNNNDDHIRNHHHAQTAEDAQREDVQRRLKIACFLCLIFLVSEIAGGLISGSLAVLSDAAHLFSDLMSFVFAVAAGHMASMPGNATYTFGYRRAEVVAALFSMISLAICSLLLLGEGFRRLWPFILFWTRGTDIEEIQEVEGSIMSIIAFIGVLVNIALALVLGVENHVHMPGDDHGHDHGHGHAHGHEEDHDNGHQEHHSHEENHDHGHQEHHSHGHNKENGLGGHGHGHDHGKDHGHDHGHGHEHGHGHDDHDKFELEEADIEENISLSKRDPDNDLLFSQSPPHKPKENINLRAAYLHVLGDLAQSVAVLIAGVVIWYKPEWHAIDPILNLIFCPVIFYSTLGIIRSSVNILLEGAPADVSLDALQSSIESVDGVTTVRDLHVWSITHGSVAMTVHAGAKDPQSALYKIHDICTRRHGINHCTIQLEMDTGDGSTDYSICGPGMDYCYTPGKSTAGEYELVERRERP